MSSQSRTADHIPLRAEPMVIDSPEFLEWQEGERRRLGVPDPLRLPVVAKASTKSYTKSEPERDNRNDHGTIVSTVANERVEWLWRRYVPLGYITLLDGEPDKGKSLMTLDIIARVTTAKQMPDGTRGIRPAGAVIWTVEDGLADVIKPRLERAGADTERIIHRTIAVDSEGFSRSLTVADTERMRRDIERVGAKLVVLDPLSAFLGKADSHRDSDVRAALSPMQNLLHEMGVAGLFVRHLTKAVGGSAMTRGMGSIAGVALSRSALIVGREDADDPTSMCVLARIKGNLGPSAPSLRYRPVGDPEDEDAPPWIEWHGVSDKTADELVAAPDQPRSVVAEAADWLKLHLSYGPVPTKELFGDARAEGFSEASLKRAKERLPIDAFKEPGKMGGPWLWGLSKEAPTLPDELLLIDKERLPINLVETSALEEARGRGKKLADVCVETLHDQYASVPF